LARQLAGENLFYYSPKLCYFNKNFLKDTHATAQRRKDCAKEIHEKCFAIPLRLSVFA
jgi:hypothetical protein